MNDKLNKLFIFPQATIKEAMKQMDLAAEKILIVIDHGKHLLGMLSDGDIRRFILKTGNIKGQIEGCYNKNPTILLDGENQDNIKNIMIEKKIEAIPVVDKNNRVIDILIWSYLFKSSQKPLPQIDCPVVIMAGGKGKRLDPFTKILPKPLIPVGDKPILELIMDQFNQYGVKNFYLTVNFKGEMIKSYFDNIDLKYNLNYIWEKEFLGTAGSLKLLPKNFPSTFILTNCDIIVYADYADLIKFHKKNGNDLTMVGSFHHFVIPYGVVKFSTNGLVEKIDEKPEYDFTINTGIYVIERSALDYIPENTIL